MKKYFLLTLLIALVPNMVFGASARYTQLVREKQRKMEQLEKCMGASKGLKIAGVSTLGLTAAGVAANIAEAKTIKSNEKTIEKKDEKIDSLNKEITDKQAAKAKREAEAAEQAALLAECKTKLVNAEHADKIETVRKNDSGTCDILSCSGDFEVSKDGQSCVEKTEKVSETDFMKKCIEIGGTNDKTKIGQTTFEGKVISVNIPVYEGCVLPDTVTDLTTTCKDLVATCEEGKNYIHLNKETKFCACIGDLDTKCLNGEKRCWDDGLSEEVHVQKCGVDVELAADSKWKQGYVLVNETTFYTLAVQDDDKIYKQYKTNVYQEIFAELKQTIDNFVIPDEAGQTWKCGDIVISSDSCAGKTFNQCNSQFYKCKLDEQEAVAQSRAKRQYIDALIQAVCF